MVRNLPFGGLGLAEIQNIFRTGAMIPPHARKDGRDLTDSRDVFSWYQRLLEGHLDSSCVGSFAQDSKILGFQLSTRGKQVECASLKAQA